MDRRLGAHQTIGLASAVAAGLDHCVGAHQTLGLVSAVAAGLDHCVGAHQTIGLVSAVAAGLDHCVGAHQTIGLVSAVAAGLDRCLGAHQTIGLVSAVAAGLDRCLGAHQTIDLTQAPVSVVHHLCSRRVDQTSAEVVGYPCTHQRTDLGREAAGPPDHPTVWQSIDFDLGADHSAVRQTIYFDLIWTVDHQLSVDLFCCLGRHSTDFVATSCQMIDFAAVASFGERLQTRLSVLLSPRDCSSIRDRVWVCPVLLSGHSKARPDQIQDHPMVHLTIGLDWAWKRDHLCAQHTDPVDQMVAA
jgi:hypothetical protein